MTYRYADDEREEDERYPERYVVGIEAEVIAVVHL